MFKKIICMLTVLTLCTTSIFITTSYGLDLWSEYKLGVSNLNKNKCQQAINSFKKVEKSFLSSKNNTNIAILYKNLGLSNAKLGNYDLAQKYWMKEAEYWKKVGYEQDAIAAERKANMIRNEIRLFTLVDASEAGSKLYHGVKYEPVVGAMLGAYAADDLSVENPAQNKFHTIEYPIMTEKAHAGYLYYFSYGDSLDRLKKYAQKLKQVGGIMQIGVEPLGGIDKVNDDEYLEYFVSEIKNLDIPVFVRFANEMNDPTSKWYFKDPNVYIEKYRLVADKVHAGAPNAVMVWAPLYFPPHNITRYYPGDNYVDWVGVSLYRQYHPELDPLGKNVDRARFIDQFNTIYKLYADKKPVFVSEGGVSYQNSVNGNDITSFAAKELSDYYTYMPILYPKLKAIFYFDENVKSKYTRYMLSTNSSLLETYKKGIKDTFYLGKVGENAASYYEELPQYTVKPCINPIYSYVKSADPDVCRVAYKINGQFAAASNSAPFEADIDFEPYQGGKVNIIVEAYNSNSKLIAKKIFEVKVSAKQ
ncbi:MAG: glycoside hydrolase family 26 protein [Deltaproteobacteria bacterium]